MRRSSSCARSQPSSPSVGSTLIPGFTTTVGDRERVLEQINTDFSGLHADIFSAMGQRPDHSAVDETSPIWHWWQIAVAPTYAEWQKFYADQKDSWWSKWTTDWDTYTGWQSRLIILRNLARVQLAAHGHELSSPEPQGVPRTPWQWLGDVGEGAKKTAGTLKEVAIFGAVGLGLVLAVSVGRGR